MMSTKRVIIVHGSYGNPTENWFPWLADQVREAGHTALVPAFPTPENQNLQTWTEVLARDVGAIGKDDILVGHSLGAGFILRLLERTRTPVDASFLASSFTGNLGLPEFDEVNESFVTGAFAWPHVRRMSGRIYIYHGDDDPYVPVSKAQHIAEELGTEVVLIPRGGHLNAAAGLREFPRLWHDLVNVLGLRPTGPLQG